MLKNEKTLLIKEKQQFPLTIKRLGINGEGVGYFKKQVVFVPGALPGEEVVVEVTKAHLKYAEAIVKKYVNAQNIASKHRASSMNNAVDASSSI